MKESFGSKKQDLESESLRLEAIKNRANQDALKYLEKRMTKNLFDNQKIAEDSEEGDNLEKPVLNMEDAAEIMERAFEDLGIEVGTPDYLNYLDHFSIATNIGRRIE